MNQYVGQRVLVITESGTFDGKLTGYTERFASLVEVTLVTERGKLAIDGVVLLPTRKIDWVQVA